MKRTTLIVVLIATLLIGCGRRDVTSDPSYGFGSLAGSKWKLKVPIAIERNGIGDVCTDKYAAEFAAGSADLNKFSGGDDPVVGILPSGTVIRVDRLEDRGGSNGGMDVFFSVLSGKHTGETIRSISPEDIILPNTFITPGKSNTKSWAVDPDKLEKP